MRNIQLQSVWFWKKIKIILITWSLRINKLNIIQTDLKKMNDKGKCLVGSGQLFSGSVLNWTRGTGLFSSGCSLLRKHRNIHRGLDSKSTSTGIWALVILVFCITTADWTYWKRCVFLLFGHQNCVWTTITVNTIIYQSTEWQRTEFRNVGPHKKSQTKPYFHDSLQRCCSFRDSLWMERYFMLIVWFI